MKDNECEDIKQVVRKPIGLQEQHMITIDMTILSLTFQQMLVELPYILQITLLSIATIEFYICLDNGRSRKSRW